MARLWSCGFELLDAPATPKEWAVGSGAATTGTPTISTTTKRYGAGALRINPTAATQYIEHQLGSGGTAKRTFHRLYLRVATAPGAQVTVYSIGQASNPTHQLRLNADMTLRFYDGTAAAVVGTASAALDVNRWYRIEIDDEDNGASASAITGYIDGVQFSTSAITSIDTTPGGISRVRIGTFVSGTVDYFVDDVAVNDTTGTDQISFPGVGCIVHMQPNATGDNNFFATQVGGTAGSANNYTRVSEVTPDDATSYNETTATGTTTIDDFNVESATNALMKANSRITLVQVGARLGSSATTTASIVLRIMGQASGTVLESSSISVALNGWATHKAAAPYPYQLTAYRNPQDSAAWTTTTLGTMQIGYRGDVSQTSVRRVSTLWALVEFVPILEALQDNFDDNTWDVFRWPNSFGTYSETGGRARVACDTGYSAYSSGTDWCLKDSYGAVQMFPPAGGGSTSEAWSQMLIKSNVAGVDVGIEAEMATGDIRFFDRVGYFDAGQTILTYDAVEHAWVRIREAAGTTYWETAPDGVTWTVRRTKASNSWVGDCDLEFQLIAHRSDGTNDYAEYDNVNIAPQTDYVQEYEDSAGVTDDVATELGHPRTFDDNAGITDSTTIEKFLGVNPDDTVGVTDTTSFVYAGIRTFDDSAGVTDSIAKDLSQVDSDTVGITDSVTIDHEGVPIVAASSRPMVGLVIKLFDAAGDVTTICPDLKAVSWTDELSASGTVSIEYPAGGLNSAAIRTDRAEGAVFWGEVEIPGTRFLVSEQASNILDEQGAVVKINAPAFVGKRLEEAIVHPARWPTTTPPQQTFTDATPGEILLTLISQAQSRGVLGNLETDFTGVVDSDGVAWTQEVSMTIDVGETYRAVLNKLVEMATVDWRGDGRTLQMYNWGTMGSDLSVGASPVVLFAGRDMVDAPENRSVKDLVNSVYSLGEDAWSAQVSDSSSIATFGRIEGFISSSGVFNTGTLSVIGQAYLDKMKHVQQEFTHTLTFADETSPVPYEDYRVGDKVLRVVNGVQGAYVVRQLTFSMNDNGDLQSTVTLNDKFYTQDVLLQKKINALTGGSASSTSSPADPTKDIIGPNPPTSVTVISSAYVGNAGVTYSAVQASWTEPTSNTDGSTFTDLDRYEVQWKYDTETNYHAAGTTAGNVLQWDQVLPGRNMNVRVRAVDRNANASAWSTVANHLSASDSTPPAQPSTPTVSNYLGVLRVTWNGLTQGGAAQPLDFAGAEVHISTVNDFTPSAATKVDTLPAAGVSVISALHDGTPLVYGTTYYVKLISYDLSGNASTVSAQGSGSPQQVVQTDIGTGQVGLSNLSFSDVGNLVDDGSFELSNWRTARTATLPTGWAFNTDQANNGLYSLKIQNTVGGTVNWTMRTGVNVQFGEVYLGVFDYRMTGTTAAGTVTLVAVYKNAAGGTVSEATLTTASVVDSTWHARTAGTETSVPSGASSMDILVRVTGITAGSAWIDAVEIRQRIDTLLLANLAVTNAKIADLAVNNAKISDLAVGKVTAGTIVADWIVGARIKTADAGARVEINSTGIQAFNSGGTNTVQIKSSDGTMFAQGQMVSGLSGKRLEVNPTATYLPEIRLYPNTGANYAYLNAVSSPDGTEAWVGLNSGTFTQDWTGETSHNRLFMLDNNSGMLLEMIRSSDGAQNGPRLQMWEDQITMQMKNTNDADYLGFMQLGRQHAQIGINRGGTSADAWLKFNEDGKWDSIGRFFDYVGVASTAALFTGSVSPTDGASSWATTFGPTMASQLLPLVSIRDNVVHSQAITASSNTGFEVTISPAASGAWVVYFWCFRI